MPTIEYAGMNAVDMAAWVVIATLAGLAARQMFKGKPLAGLWSDLVIGLVGAFALGWGMRQIGFDLSKSILAAQPGISSHVAIWVDIFVAAFVAAIEYGSIASSRSAVVSTRGISSLSSTT